MPDGLFGSSPGQTVTAAPPVTAIRFSVRSPFVTNAIDWPSGENTGLIGRIVVSVSATASSDEIALKCSRLFAR